MELELKLQALKEEYSEVVKQIQPLWLREQELAKQMDEVRKKLGIS